MVSSTSSEAEQNSDRSGVARTSRLTIFAFLWACQALVHQEFYSSWLHEHDPLGWLVTIFGVATLLRPSSLVLFGSLLVSSICYNIAKWPFVVNHILLETLINFTILSALLQSWLVTRKQIHTDWEFRENVYSRFAPVVWTALVIVYGFAFLAKLNWDFVSPDVSCVVKMYGDLLRRFPFLPSSPTAYWLVIASTLLVEALIPLLLAFRRTRVWGVAIGVSFHFVLGLVGHRTFSGLAYVLYSLALMNQLIPMVDHYRRSLSNFFSPKIRAFLFPAFATSVVCVVFSLIAADLNRYFREKILVIKVYQLPWLIWIGWSLGIGLFYSIAVIFHRESHATSLSAHSVRPGFSWAVIGLVALNGLSQYLGFKTETCFTMYSNLRTEGQWNNHMFMPALRLASYQEDLVEIVATNHPQLKDYLEHRDLITYFELRRIVNKTDADFQLTYIHNGQQQEFQQKGRTRRSTQDIGPHPLLLGKVLYFRPVSTEECVSCRH